ncbi:MAG TPA: methyltransferase domain-containing protein [Solirubrobacterales bacterium]
MKVTGERTVTSVGGFNPAWQRHVAAYVLCEPFLGPGRVLDLGCGIGHSYDRLAPRETVGSDIDPEALAGQERETVMADMRELPFDDESFASVIASHAVEHVPDPQRVVAEAARVLERDGVAAFVTPNRLTFGRPDEIIDPYHYVELNPDELHSLCEQSFGEVDVRGLFASDAYMELFREERAKLDRLLRLDPVRLRRLVPRAIRRSLYDGLLRRYRPARDSRAEAITIEDFELRSDRLEESLDLYAFCRSPAA